MSEADTNTKGLFKRAWTSWKKFAAALGRVQTRILLTLFFFLVAGPAWLFAKVFRRDLLNRRRGRDLRYWADYEAADDQMERARHLF